MFDTQHENVSFLWTKQTSKASDTDQTHRWTVTQRSRVARRLGMNSVTLHGMIPRNIGFEPVSVVMTTRGAQDVESLWHAMPPKAGPFEKRSPGQSTALA